MEKDGPIEGIKSETGELEDERFSILIGQRPSGRAADSQDGIALAHLSLAGQDILLPWTAERQANPSAALRVLHIYKFVMRNVLPRLIPHLAKEAPLNCPEDARLAF